MDQSVLNVVSVIATSLAAIFAGLACLSSAKSAARSRDLVELERDRDLDSRKSQARAVAVTMMAKDLPGIGATDLYLHVLNGSSLPIMRARIRALAGDETIWGNQFVGPIGPGQATELYARIYRTDLIRCNAQVRFNDSWGVSWVASASGELVQAGDDIEDWTREAAKFAGRQLDMYERGSITGTLEPQLDDWADGMTLRARVKTSTDRTVDSRDGN